MISLPNRPASQSYVYNCTSAPDPSEPSQLLDCKMQKNPFVGELEEVLFTCCALVCVCTCCREICCKVWKEKFVHWLMKSNVFKLVGSIMIHRGWFKTRGSCSPPFSWFCCLLGSWCLNGEGSNSPEDEEACSLFICLNSCSSEKHYLSANQSKVHWAEWVLQSGQKYLIY